MGERQIRPPLSEFVRNRWPAPGDAQIPDVGPGDLAERRILRASFIATMIRPLAALRSLLRSSGHPNGEPNHDTNDGHRCGSLAQVRLQYGQGFVAQFLSLAVCSVNNSLANRERASGTFVGLVLTLILKKVH